MLKNIKIRDYRSCTNTSFQCHPSLTVLIGPNGSGKTNILQAIMLLQKSIQQDQSLSPMEMATVQSRLSALFEDGNMTAELNAKVASYTDESNTDVVVGQQCKWKITSSSGKIYRTDMPLFVAPTHSRMEPWTEHIDKRLVWSYQRHFSFWPPENRKTSTAIATVTKFIAGLKYYGASQFTNPANCPVSFEIEKEGETSRAWRIRGHAKFLYDMYRASQAKNTRYGEFLDVIGQKGLRLVDDIAFQEITTSSIDYTVRSGGKVVERRKDKFLIIPKFFKGTHALSPNQLSEGTFKTVVLLFYLMTETSSGMLIEEPEVCIHHGLLASILELIKNYSKERQIILSTHSDYVLDKVEPENVFGVTIDDESGTRVKQMTKSLSKNEILALRDYLDTVGNLGEYWRSGALEKASS